MDAKENKELSSALKRRRDRYARHAHHIIQQQELINNSHGIYNGLFEKNDQWANKTYNGTYTGTNGTYNPANKYITNGTNGTIYNNDINGQEDEKYTRKSNLPDVLMNGLCKR